MILALGPYKMSSVCTDLLDLEVSVSSNGRNDGVQRPLNLLRLPLFRFFSLTLFIIQSLSGPSVYGAVQQWLTILVHKQFWNTWCFYTATLAA